MGDGGQNIVSVGIIGAAIRELYTAESANSGCCFRLDSDSEPMAEKKKGPPDRWAQVLHP
jgi:hypothetical protein